MPGSNFFGANLVGQEPWQRRGENEGRLRAAETTIAANTASLALINTGVWADYNGVVLAQGATVTKTINWSRYLKIGRAVFYIGQLAVTGTGTATTGITVSLPFTSINAVNQVCGTGEVVDASPLNVHRAIAGIHAGLTTLHLAPAYNQVADILGVTGFTTALASGDSVSWSIMYEATS